MEEWKDSLWFVFVGICIALSKLLDSKEKITPRIAIGRALSTGGIAMAAGLILIWFPNVPWGVQLGAAAALASLGTSGLERMFQRVIGGNGA
jgi:hypothetical protein